MPFCPLCRLTNRNVAGRTGDPLFGEEEGQNQEFALQLAALAIAQDREAQVGHISTPSKRRERTRGPVRCLMIVCVSEGRLGVLGVRSLVAGR